MFENFLRFSSALQTFFDKLEFLEISWKYSLYRKGLNISSFLKLLENNTSKWNIFKTKTKAKPPEKLQKSKESIFSGEAYNSQTSNTSNEIIFEDFDKSKRA